MASGGPEVSTGFQKPHRKVEVDPMQASRWRTTREWRKRIADQLKAHPLCQRCGAPAVTVDLAASEPESARFIDIIRLPVVSLCQRCADDKQPSHPPYMGLDNKPRWNR